MTNPKCLIKIDCARGKFEPCPTMTNCAATNKLLTTIILNRILRDEAMKALEDAIFPDEAIWNFVTTYPFFGCVEEYDFNWYAENIDWDYLTVKLVEYRRYNKI